MDLTPGAAGCSLSFLLDPRPYVKEIIGHL